MSIWMDGTVFFFITSVAITREAWHREAWHRASGGLAPARVSGLAPGTGSVRWPGPDQSAVMMNHPRSVFLVPGGR